MQLNYCELWVLWGLLFFAQRVPWAWCGAPGGVGMECWRWLLCGSTGLLWHCVGPTSPVGARVLFWEQVGGEGSAPEPRSPGWEVGMGVLVWLLPALPTAMECLFVA